MTENSKIEWTDHTFNPWTGCTKVSPACDHCYAEGWAKRSGAVKWGPGEPRRRTTEANWRKPLQWNRQAEQQGIRYRVFCASLADVFDNEVLHAWRQDLFELIGHTPNLDWLLLTKRIGNVNNMVLGGMPSNVWLGITVANQAEADRDIPKLLNVPAQVRFLSMEPLLGPVRLDRILLGSGPATFKDYPHITKAEFTVNALKGAKSINWSGIDWVIAGGESGHKARPMHPDWARSLRDQCVAAGVPFFFKQWGEYADLTEDKPGSKRLRESTSDLIMLKTGEIIGAGYRRGRKSEGMVDSNWRQRGAAWMGRIGKKAAGRLLDGKEYSEFPDEKI